jgi:phosphoglycolate phosphatase-like HAD superfamily hydrolase
MRMMLDNYIKLEMEGKTAYINRTKHHKLKEVDTLLFDCDGVIIDAQESYNRSISKTVAFLAQNLFKIQISDEVISDNVIYRFRKSGGFNNDWDTSYVILLYLFTKITKPIIDQFYQLFFIDKNDFMTYEPYTRYYEASKFFKNLEYDIDSIEETNLMHLAEKADSSGLISIEKELLKNNSKIYLDVFKDLLMHPSKVGVSMINTVFEEIFLGSDLYIKKYQINPKFFPNHVGLLSSEKLLIKNQTLVQLVNRFEKPNLGIVSGRSIQTAEITLGGMLSLFNNDIMFFIEDEIHRALKKGDDEAISRLAKPNPHSLLDVEKKTSKTGKILYVGDSKEDILMVRKANEIKDRFIAGGIYGGINPDESINMFMENGVELILESINDLPLILYRINRNEEI